ncbi:MAG: transposase [Nitrospinae bacterium]|nr:transposase [Nitrospinota bacterium]
MNELIGIPTIDEAEIITLSEMEDFIARHQINIIHLPTAYRKRYIVDAELRAIDELIDNDIINRLLAPKGYTPCCRTIFPFNLFRAELLKSLKYPELSYRKYCDNQLNKLEQKTNRAFIGLPIHKKVTISHSQLSQFRSGLTFGQMVNLMVYAIHLFIKRGIIDSRQVIHGVDSAELPAVCNPRPLATIEVKGKKVRIYGDLDADCGKRRNKRDKSEYFVGYRIHSLTAINSKTGHSYPIISLIAPGNHHDNLLLPPLVKLGKAIGLDLKVITADEAYTDVEQNEAMKREYDVTVVSTSKEKVKLPDYVDEKTKSVYMNKWCETPMSYLGITDEGNHEFKCNDELGSCLHDINCPKYREIPIDAGNFGQIPDNVNGVKKVKDLRKNVERPFNLLKHRDGLEPVRVKSQHGLMAVSTFVNIVNLLLEIVATRKTERKESNQLKLKLAA